MEYRYYRELKHNYLIIKNEAYTGAESEDNKSLGYQIKILEGGNLKGFVPCDRRTINSEQFLYYRIDSMQSLKNAHLVKGMGAEQLTALFSGLKKAIDNLSEYLLGMENVILEPGSIFTDLSTGEYRFMYCPFEQEKSDLSSFAEKLLEIVDQEDQTAVEMIYAFCDRTQLDGALLLDCIEHALSIGNAEPEPVAMQKQPEISMPETFDWNQDEDLEEDDEEDTQPIIRKKKNTLDFRAQILFAFMFFVLVAAMVFIRLNFILTETENILSIVVMVVSMVTGIIAFLSGIRDMTQKDGKDTDDLFDEDDFEEVEYDQETYNRPIMVTPSGNTSDAGRYDSVVAPEKPLMNRMAMYETKKTVAPAVDCGETVVLDQDDDEDKVLTLYSRNLDKTVRICLDKLPLTIGKLEGCVDKVVKDNSISRIHCRFSQDPSGRVIVTDLNSTNGTYKNGLRLNVQEENYVEEGDEIKIGRICFDCR